jgi:hypothetical protein
VAENDLGPAERGGCSGYRCFVALQWERKFIAVPVEVCSESVVSPEIPQAARSSTVEKINPTVLLEQGKQEPGFNTGVIDNEHGSRKEWGRYVNRNLKQKKK